MTRIARYRTQVVQVLRAAAFGEVMKLHAKKLSMVPSLPMSEHPTDSNVENSDVIESNSEVGRGLPLSLLAHS